MKIEKARITSIDFFGEVIEVLMLPSGEFAIAVSQVAELFKLDKTIATRTVKALLGKDSKLDKSSSEISKNPVNIITLEQFEKVIVALSIKGNKKAQQLNLNLVGLSLIQLCSDAFGIKFEKEKREAWVKFRSAHKKQYHPKLTYWFKADGCEGKEYGARMNYLKAHLGLPLKTIDKYSEQELDKLNEAEVEYHALRRSGLSHCEAIKIIG